MLSFKNDNKVTWCFVNCFFIIFLSFLLLVLVCKNVILLIEKKILHDCGHAAVAGQSYTIGNFLEGQEVTQKGLILK